jgi:hypothetical protein
MPAGAALLALPYQPLGDTFNVEEGTVDDDVRVDKDEVRTEVMNVRNEVEEMRVELEGLQDPNKGLQPVQQYSFVFPHQLYWLRFISKRSLYLFIGANTCSNRHPQSLDK